MLLIVIAAGIAGGLAGPLMSLGILAAVAIITALLFRRPWVSFFLALTAVFSYGAILYMEQAVPGNAHLGLYRAIALGLRMTRRGF